MNNKTISAITVIWAFLLLYACGRNETKPAIEPTHVSEVSAEPVSEILNGEAD